MLVLDNGTGDNLNSTSGAILIAGTFFATGIVISFVTEALR